MDEPLGTTVATAPFAAQPHVTEANRSQTEQMQDLKIFTVVRTEIGQIIGADVNRERVSELVWPDGE